MKKQFIWAPFSFFLSLILINHQCFAAESAKKESFKSAISKELPPKDLKLKENKSSKLSAMSMSSSSAGGGTMSSNVQASAVHVEPFTGSANLSIPIAVPPGRGGVQPNLALSYSSTNRSSGVAGVGWSLDIGSIQRSLKKGVPTYDDSKDAFTLMQANAQDLVKDPNSNRYYAEIEESFAKVEKFSNYWLVTDKKGTKYYFGNTDDSRQYDPANANHIFRWALNKVEDINGNYMAITYIRDNGQIYLQTLDYTGNRTLTPYGHVIINYGTTSVNSTSYITGFKVINTKCINAISVNINSSLQSKYIFSYKQSASTRRDLLQSVQQIGSDGVTNLPAVNFTYSDNEVKGYTYDSTAGTPSAPVFAMQAISDRMMDNGVRVTDVNGDNYPDLVRYYTDCGNNLNRTTWINNKQNDWVSQSSWLIDTGNDTMPGFTINCPDYDLDMGVQMVDVDGDGRVDVERNFKQGPHWGSSSFKFAQINDGISQWVKDDGWQMPDDAITSYELWEPDSGGISWTLPGASPFADINGDGYVDIGIARPDDYAKNAVYLNNKGMDAHLKGWGVNSQWAIPAGVNFAKCALADVNGDGLADIICLDKVTENYVLLNTGSGWQDGSSYSTAVKRGLLSFTNGTTQLVDVNGDGLVDMNYLNGNDSDAFVLINTGDGWIEDKSWITHGGNEDLSTQFLDIDANGMVDYLIFFRRADSVLIYSRFLNQGKPADMLQRIDNGIGVTTDIAYESSAHYQNTFLPFIMQVVKSVTTTVANPVGASSLYTTRYDYAGGLWDATYREFQGFKTVKVIDADGNYAVTTFAQDHWLKGRPIEQASYDKDGKLFTKTTSQWQTQDIITSVTKFVFLKRSDDYLYDGNTTPKRTAQELTYGQNPQYGDPTQMVNYGEVDPASGLDIGMDKLTTQTDYICNTTLWLLGLPKSMIISNSVGAEIAKTWFYYDNATSLTVAPSLGQLTKKVNWSGGPQDVSTLYAYDVYGNLKSTTDALGRTTTITYDNTVKMFPIQTTNALGQIVKTTYYGIDGAAVVYALWGQVKTVTDANNQGVMSQYDCFGRIFKSIGPLDTLDKPTTQISYKQNSNYNKITTISRVDVGGTATITSASYYDGLGRLIQNKSLGPVPGQYIVSGQAEYNNRGLPIRQYPPYFTNKDFNNLDVIDGNQPVTQAQYDAMGRMVKTINPDGTYSNVVYDRWTSTSYDPNGHMQKSYADAFGRLIQKEEYSGADGRSSYYPAASYQLYAKTIYGYDVKGNLTSVTDAKGNVTAIAYDILGRKTSMDDPDMGHWEYGYDLLGNLVSQKDAKVKTLSFNYDVLNRLTSRNLVTYNYDDASQAYGKGRLGSVAYGTAGESASFVYDAVGREITSTKRIDTKSYSVNRQYDDLNRLKQLLYPNGTAVKYTINQAGQINSVMDDGTGTNIYIGSVQYNASSQVTQIKYGNGVTTSYTYDSKNRQLKRIYSLNFQNQKLQDLNYTYDALGQITAIVDAVNTSSQTFKYDALNRLIYANGSYGVKNYVYDEIGNIIQKDGLTYRYAEANSRLDAAGVAVGKAGPHAVTSLSDGTVFKYDANGNMVSLIKGTETTTYTYDDENRLIKISSQTAGQAAVTIAVYCYDGDGGRTKKTVYRRDKAIYNSKSTTAFMYKDYNGQAWPGTATNVKTIVTRFVGSVYEEEDPGTDGVLRKTKFIYLGSTKVAAVNSGSAEVMFYLTDHLGSTNVLVDNAGLARELNEYDPFGLVIKHENYGAATAQMWYYFTGKGLDDESGLMFYGARYYNPTLGRFITPDIIVQAPSNPQTLNRYTYCNNNPVNLIDPSGHSWSWGKFFKSLVSTFAQIVTTVVLTPFIGPVAAGAVGGFVGGALNAGLNGASFGQAIMSGIIGAGIGGLGGAAFGSTGVNGFLGSWGPGVGIGLLVAGGAYSAATGNLDSFTGGLIGGIGGYAAGTRITTGKWPWGQANQAQRNVGTNQTVGNEKNTPENTLDINQGAKASSKQALKSRYTYDPQSKVVKGYVVDGVELPQPSGTTKMTITIDDLTVEEYIPNGWNVDVTANGKGLLFSDPASNASIRIMGRSDIYADGYKVVHYYKTGQAMNPYTSKPGGKDNWHIPYVSN